MRSAFWYKTARLWLCGGLLFVLRLAQNKTGFEAGTGLSLPSVPGTALAVCLVAAAAVELLLSLRLNKDKRSFRHHFAPPEKSLTALVVGCMLLAAGGVLLALESFTAANIAAIVTGLLALATGAGLLVLGRQLRAGVDMTVTHALPSLFFGVFLVLTVYLPAVADPVLARYYLQVLASAMASYAFGRLAGFLRGDSTMRGFTPMASFAVMTCIAAMADGGVALSLLFGGCAVVLSVFLALQRETVPTSEEEPPQQTPSIDEA